MEPSETSSDLFTKRLNLLYNGLAANRRCCCGRCLDDILLQLKQDEGNSEAQTTFRVFFHTEDSYKEAKIIVRGKVVQPSPGYMKSTLCKALEQVKKDGAPLYMELSEAYDFKISPAFDAVRHEPRFLSLDTLFWHQSTLHGDESILTRSGKIAMAITAASGVLALGLTLWSRQTFTYADVCFALPPGDLLSTLSRSTPSVTGLPETRDLLVRLEWPFATKTVPTSIQSSHDLLVHLGVLLIEMYRGRQLQSLPRRPEVTLRELRTEGETRFCYSGKSDFTWQALTALEDSFGENDYAEVIKSCLRGFKNDTEKRMAYDAIFESLEKVQPSISKDYSAGKIPQKEGFWSTFAKQKMTPASTVVEFSERQQSSGEKSTSKEWKSISRMLLSLVGKTAPVGLRAVKIAIFDSGYSVEGSLPASESRRIRLSQNFTDTPAPNPMKDECGHGTHTLGTVLKAPLADIYVAKIARQKLEVNTERLPEAIRIASEDWKADIMVMPLGVPYNARTAEAIRQAMAKGTLILAAASNEGANFDRAFPANQSGVFAVHATDDLGRPSRFNPPSDKWDCNFAVLGEGIVSLWPKDLNKGDASLKAQTGTSMATAVEAVYASVLLTIVRLEELRMGKQEDSVERWLKYDGMRCVFKNMSVDSGGYDYIQPSQLFKGSRHDIYQRICQLKNMYV